MTKNTILFVNENNELLAFVYLTSDGHYEEIIKSFVAVFKDCLADDRVWQFSEEWLLFWHLDEDSDFYPAKFEFIPAKDVTNYKIDDYIKVYVAEDNIKVRVPAEGTEEARDYLISLNVINEDFDVSKPCMMSLMGKRVQND